MSVAVWHTGTKAETLRFLRENKAAVDRDDPDLMSEAEDETGVTDWQVAVLRCRICSKKQLVIISSAAMLKDMECSNCGNMACDPIDDEDEDEVFA